MNYVSTQIPGYDKPICQQFVKDKLRSLAFSKTAQFLIIGVNYILRLFIIKLIIYIGKDTESEQTRLIANGVFIVQFFNTAILLLICNANLAEQGLGFINGRFADFDAATVFAQFFGGGRRSRRTPDRSEYPVWELPAPFEHDCFTFVRIQYDSIGGGGRGGGGWSNDFPDCDWNFSYRLQQLTSMQVDPKRESLASDRPGAVRLSVHLHVQRSNDVLVTG